MIVDTAYPLLYTRVTWLFLYILCPLIAETGPAKEHADEERSPHRLLQTAQRSLPL
jgi:hypothetical protein